MLFQYQYQESETDQNLTSSELSELFSPQVLQFPHSLPLTQIHNAFKTSSLKIM